MKVCVICANGVEECEALVTVDLLKRAGLEVDILGLDFEIESTHGIKFKADALLKEKDITQYDCLVLPGGMPGTTNLEADENVQNAIDYFMKENKLIAAICAAPSILIHKGLLKSKEFTCYPGCECGLERLNEKAHKHNNIITGNGLGGVFEFSSLIITTLIDNVKALNVMVKIQY